MDVARMKKAWQVRKARREEGPKPGNRTIGANPGRSSKPGTGRDGARKSAESNEDPTTRADWEPYGEKPLIAVHRRGAEPQEGMSSLRKRSNSPEKTTSADASEWQGGAQDKAAHRTQGPLAVF